jgi:hypothetical protein
MAIETIRQVLAPSGAPEINGVRAQSLVSKALLKNAYQGLVETNNRGVSDRFATESEVNEAAQIFVNRILPVKMKAREQGSSKNGGSFSSNSHYTQTQTVGIELLTTIDDTIIIPRARQELINVDLLAEQVDIYSRRLNTIINGATTAAHLFTPYVEDAKGKEIYLVNITDEDIANKKVLDRFLEVNDLLDTGDPEHDVDIFPLESRIACFKVGTRAVLKGAGILNIGGANYAYDIAKGHAVSHADTTAVSENGYIGDIDGVPCHVISGESLRHAAGFLGLTEYDLSNSAFFGYVASSYATARGVTTTEKVKIVDAVAGQGLILQPYTRLGVVSWYAKGQVLITKNDFKVDGEQHGLYDYIKGLFTTEYSTGEFVFKLKAEGSRLYPTITSIAATSNSLTVNATAKDDQNIEHAVAGHYVVTDKPVKTVYEFCKAVYGGNEPANDGLESLAGATSGAFASGKYVNVLVIADDGSCSIASTVVA